MLTYVVAFSTLVMVKSDAATTQDGYPRISHKWNDTTSKVIVEGKLINVTEEKAVVETKNKKKVTLELKKLDKTSREIAEDAYPHFVVEKKIRGIIEQIIEKAAKENSSRGNLALQKMLIAKANAELRKLKIKLRYRITSVRKTSAGSYMLRFTNIYRWNVTPVTFMSLGRRPTSGYLKGWTMKAADFDPAKVELRKSVFEMTGVPQLYFPVARDFSWRGLGYKKGANRRSLSTIQIGFAVIKHEVQVFTPGE